MRHSHPRRWQTRRFVRPAQPLAHPESRLIRMMNTPEPPIRRHDIPLELRQEPPCAEGIRQGLVSHVRQLIADGVYDTPERWEAAQERLFRRIERIATDE